MGKWISVKDRLPEKNGNYLVVCRSECRKRMIGIRHFFERTGAFMLDRTVTHWMPLPEPPGCDARTAYSRWRIPGKTRYVWVCANCGYGEGMTCSEEDDSENDANPYWNYCPYCGAEMDMGTCERDAEI